MSSYIMGRDRLSDRIKSLRDNPYILLFLLHASSFLVLFVSALLFFNTDLLSSLWAPGSQNDSKLYVSNSLNYPPWHPHVLLGTTLHYIPGLFLLSFFLSISDALTISILFVQFSFSFLTLCFLYSQYTRFLSLRPKQAIGLLFVMDLVLFSPYLLLATPEILFLFYQSLTWYLFQLKRYGYAGISAAMTFALRYNGAFFVIGTLIILGLSIKKNNRSFSYGAYIRGGIIIGTMFLIGFSSYIAAWFYSGDFWLPLTREIGVYQGWEPYASNGVITFPFAWFPGYVMWVLGSGFSFELLLLGTVLISLGLGCSSLYMLYRVIEETPELERDQILLLTLLYLSGFLGVSIVVSGRNLARFLTFSYPVYPVLPLGLRKYDLSRGTWLVLILLAGVVWTILNVGWWITY